MYNLILLCLMSALLVQLALCDEGWKPCIPQGSSCPSDEDRICCPDLHCDPYTISCLPSW
nr:venom polypeptide precursor [Doratifera vulnerans]